MPTELDAFRHEALLYAGERDFVSAVGDFVRDGLANDEPVMVALVPPKIQLLRAALGAEADRVLFVDMTVVGRNPARIIPAWRRFLDGHALHGRPVRGVGEPVWAGRSAAEVDECHIHESLLNEAFGAGSPWWLVCPYDVGGLDASTVSRAGHTHPVLRCDRRCDDSPGFVDWHAAYGFDSALPAPPPSAHTVRFGQDELAWVRRAVAAAGAASDLSAERVEEAVLAVHELATNSVRHGGGGGALCLWRDAGTLLCEVRDAGYVEQPLIGRLEPDLIREGGRGLWLVNELCDLVQLRSSPAGTVVRVHIAP